MISVVRFPPLNRPGCLEKSTRTCEPKLDQGHDRADFFEHLAAQKLAFDCQSSPLIVVEQNAFLAEFFLST
jgi:hypothetical protein